MGASAEAGKLELALLNVSSYAHHHVVLRTDLILGAHHANPADPQIDEFMLAGVEISMVVDEHEKGPGEQPTRTGAMRVRNHPDAS